ncbi:hypothetical protein MKW98_029602 [Papaver atlanticum]|uniref:Uncharacterized protein n=1 Tax=Papaver atlanticum TaxID=357466 RepID=A0AAD4T6E1_9MAGN|nr:hypothetical protein MKW98_029602 [Papaver atlanticum]
MNLSVQHTTNGDGCTSFMSTSVVPAILLCKPRGKRGSSITHWIVVPKPSLYRRRIKRAWTAELLREVKMWKEIQVRATGIIGLTWAEVGA